MAAPAVTMPSSPRALPGRRYDRVFFPAMAVVCLVVVLIGFAKTYFLAGMVRAPLPDRLIHLHGAVFTSWLVLLIVQTGLVSARRLDLHKKLGLAGFGLACLMVVMGLLAARDALLRGSHPVPGISAAAFFIVPVSDMFVFATLIYFGWALRFKGVDHKRLMMIGTIALLDAAVARWPFGYIQQGPHVLADLTVYALLLVMMGYDLWSTRKVQKVTLYASLLIIVVQQIRIPIAFTPVWLKFADLVQGKV